MLFSRLTLNFQPKYYSEKVTDGEVINSNDALCHAPFSDPTTNGTRVFYLETPIVRRAAFQWGITMARLIATWLPSSEVANEITRAH